MENNTPHTLQDCFAIIDDALTSHDKNAIVHTHEFELQYASHSRLMQWIDSNIVRRYGLRGEDFFIATDLWHQLLLINEPGKFPSLILIEYRKHLLAQEKH